MDKEKAVGLFRLQLNGVFEPFLMYGLQQSIPEAVSQIVQLALELHERLEGKP